MAHARTPRCRSTDPGRHPCSARAQPALAEGSPDWRCRSRGAGAGMAVGVRARGWPPPSLLIGGVRGIGAPPFSPLRSRTIPAPPLRRFWACAATPTAASMSELRPRWPPPPARSAPSVHLPRHSIRCGAGALCAGERAGAGESRSAAGALAECGAWEQRAPPAVKRNRRRRASKRLPRASELRRAWHPDSTITSQHTGPSRPQARIRDRP